MRANPAVLFRLEASQRRLDGRHVHHPGPNGDTDAPGVNLGKISGSDGLVRGRQAKHGGQRHLTLVRGWEGVDVELAVTFAARDGGDDASRYLGVRAGNGARMTSEDTPPDAGHSGS